MLLAIAGCGGGGGGGGGSGGSSTTGTGGSTDPNGFCASGTKVGDPCTSTTPSCLEGADECGGGPVLECGPDNVLVRVYDPMCCDNGDGPLPYPDCPESAPTDGDACIPCINAQPCAYSGDLGCGPQDATAECDVDAKTWSVQMPICEG